MDVVPTATSSAASANEARDAAARAPERRGPELRAAAPAPGAPPHAESMVSAEAFAGCYAVTSDRPAALPPRLSLDTLVLPASAASGFAAGTARSAARRDAAPQTLPDRAVRRRVGAPDSLKARAHAPARGAWTVEAAGSVRMELLGTPPVVLRLRAEDAGVLRGTIEGAAVVVSLRRIACVER
jgi:hypothetical protein